MPRTIIANSRIFDDQRFLDGARALNGRRRNPRACRDQGEITPAPGDIVLDAGGAYALPGFVDLHLHGGDDCDVMDGTLDSLRRLAAFQLRQGVTSCLGTTMAAPQAQISAALATMRQHLDSGNSPFIGAHLEGPYLNAAFRGSQPQRHLRAPDRRRVPALARYSGLIKLLTLAPGIARRHAAAGGLAGARNPRIYRA